MKLRISTPLLNAVLRRIGKGMGRNRVLPYTYQIQMEMRYNRLRLTATDGNIYYTETISIPYDGENADDTTRTFCVDGDSFINLIKNVGAESVELDLQASSLVVNAEGSYTFDRIDETFNMPVPDLSENTKLYPLTRDDINLFAPVKSGLTADAVELHLLGYYLSENYLVTTSGVKLCTVEGLGQKVEQPLYLTQRYVDLLQMFDEPQVSLASQDSWVLATTDTKILYGVQHPGKSHFPPFKDFLGIEMPVRFTVEATYLGQVLNRLKVFSETTIYIKIEDNKVYFMADENGDTQEEITLQSSFGLINLTNEYNINALSELLQARAGQPVTFGMQEKSVLMLTGEDISQVLAPLVEDDE